MLNESVVVWQAIERLSSWGVTHLDVSFHDDFDGGDLWAAVDFSAGACGDRDARDQAYLVRAAMERAIRSILVLKSIQIRDLDNPCLDLRVDLRSGLFSYRGYEDRDEQKILQRKQSCWPLGEDSFFEAVEFVSPSAGPTQAAVFEAWRPHPASTIEIEWSKPGHATVTGDGRTLFYSAIWPECVPAEVALLTRAIAIRLPPPPRLHSRGVWTNSLTLDFRHGDVTLIQTEVLNLQHEFCSGIMPVSEMFWLGASEPARQSSRDDVEQWLLSGSVPAAEIDSELLLELVGVQVHRQSESDDHINEDQWPEDASEAYAEDGEDERQLLSEEIADSQDSFARSDEEGWFYGD